MHDYNYVCTLYDCVTYVNYKDKIQAVLTASKSEYLRTLCTGLSK